MTAINLSVKIPRVTVISSGVQRSREIRLDRSLPKARNCTTPCNYRVDLKS